MSEFSLAAQAVLDAWEEKLSPDVTCLTHDPEREALAAALRAAITAIGSEEMFHPQSKRTEGVKWCVQRIYAIAEELEAQ